MKITRRNLLEGAFVCTAVAFAIPLDWVWRSIKSFISGGCWSVAGHEILLMFGDVMTTQEAAERWGKSPVAGKHLCTGIQGRSPRLTAEECRKSGGVWLVTRAGMEETQKRHGHPFH